MIVFIRSRRHALGRNGHPALCCCPDGKIEANRFGKALAWETWTLNQVEGKNGSQENLVSLQSWNGKYLSAKPNGEVYGDATTVGEWEVWCIEKASNGYVSIKSQHFGKYLCCDDFFNCGARVCADRDHVEEWEEWIILNDSNALMESNEAKARQIAGAVLLGTGIVVSLGAITIPLLGFGVAGVAAGSAAAGIQSAVYGGYTCGAFSVLQSVGATLAWLPVAGGGAAIAVTGGAIANAQQNQPVEETTSNTPLMLNQNNASDFT